MKTTFFQQPIDVTNHSVAQEVLNFFTLPLSTTLSYLKLMCQIVMANFCSEFCNIKNSEQKFVCTILHICLRYGKKVNRGQTKKGQNYQSHQMVSYIQFRGYRKNRLNQLKVFYIIHVKSNQKMSLNTNSSFFSNLWM